MITPEKALQIILENISILKPKDVPIADSLGLVVAEDVSSEENIPPFDNSAMDGFAVRSKDTVGASPKNPATLLLRGEALMAGTTPKVKLKEQTAVGIMTGAPIAVITRGNMEENTTINIKLEILTAYKFLTGL